MFCIKCGGEALADNLCEECFLKGRELFLLKDVRLKFCDNCGRYFSGREMMDDERAKDFILRHVAAHGRITSSSISAKFSPDRITGSIEASGFISPCKRRINGKKDFLIYTKKMKCESCIKILGGYHEAVLQIRGPNKDRILDIAKKALRDDAIVDIKRISEGYDVKLVRKSSASRAINKLKDDFTIKQSFKLAGDKKGKKLYRNFFAIR